MSIERHLIGGWHLAKYIAKKYAPTITGDMIDDLIMWVTLGIVFGGRIGFVVFYQPEYYSTHLLQALQIWHGGMSFHGGFLGVLIAILLFAKKRGLEFWRLIDLAAIVTPIGLFFGRIANFINGELWGRVTDSPLGMIFPTGGDLPRHPSQLYEATIEGVLLFAIMMLGATRFRILDKPQFASGLFLLGYGLGRYVIEFFREPDAYLGYLWAGQTMGQLLCLPMILYGVYLIHCAQKPKLSS
jgi:phosphatidylglycerol:prolipoprotein diacylglycerol transferase